MYLLNVNKSMLGFLFLFFLLSCKKEEEILVQKGTEGYNGEIVKPLTWLALGDSYTIGQGVKEQERFPAQAVKLLDERNFSVNELNYIAVTGWTTNDLMIGLNYYKPKPHTIVSLLIGVNDQYIEWDTIGYRERLSELLKRSISLANNKPNHVFVLSIPDYSVTPFARFHDAKEIARQINQFNQIIYEVTEEFGCPFVDITPFTREAVNNPALICEDNLHPSGLDYGRWGEKLVTAIRGVL
jgi:lysophospholipase L1-like esterase